MKQRLILYHGVMPIHMEFTDDVEETFSQALKLLLVKYDHSMIFLQATCFIFQVRRKLMFFPFNLQSKGLVIEGQYVTLVQSGAQPIWRRESTHHIQVRKVQS